MKLGRFGSDGDKRELIGMEVRIRNVEKYLESIEMRALWSSICHSLSNCMICSFCTYVGERGDRPCS